MVDLIPTVQNTGHVQPRPQRKRENFSRWLDFESSNENENAVEFDARAPIKPDTALPFPISLEDLIVLQDVRKPLNRIAPTERSLRGQQLYEPVALHSWMSENHDEDETQYEFGF